MKTTILTVIDNSPIVMCIAIVLTMSTVFCILRYTFKAIQKLGETLSYSQEEDKEGN